MGKTTIIEKISRYNDAKSRIRNNRARLTLPKVNRKGLWADKFGYLYTRDEAEKINKHPLLTAPYTWPID